MSSVAKVAKAGGHLSPTSFKWGSNKTYNAITSIKWCTHIRFFLAVEPLQAGLQQNLTNLAGSFVFLFKNLANYKRNADTIVQ